MSILSAYYTTFGFITKFIIIFIYKYNLRILIKKEYNNINKNVVKEIINII